MPYYGGMQAIVLIIRKAGESVHGFTSSSINERTLHAKTEQEQKALYAKWAEAYDGEMEDHDLQSYKSVINKLSDFFKPIGHTGKVRIFDAGCGSGLLGQHLHKIATSGSGICKRQNLHIVGLDLSPEMIELAKSKDCFDELHVGSLKAPLNFPADSFDYILSSGVFIPGHCGAECIPVMLAPLCPGGYAIFTVRQAMYEEEGESFRTAIKTAGCELLDAPLMPYYGGMKANVLIVEKLVN